MNSLQATSSTPLNALSNGSTAPIATQESYLPPALTHSTTALKVIANSLCLSQEAPGQSMLQKLSLLIAEGEEKSQTAEGIAKELETPSFHAVALRLQLEI